jgi:hypothetical protein
MTRGRLGAGTGALRLEQSARAGLHFPLHNGEFLRYRVM